MPRKSKSSKSEFPVGPYSLADDAPWGGFINIRLDDDQHDAFLVWYPIHADSLLVYLVDMLAEGIKLGFSYDAENQCVITTLTGKLVDSDAARYVMTSRAGTFDEALALAVWKHTEVAHGNYRDFLPRSGTFKSWG